MNTDKTKLALFEEKEIRRKWKDNDWYFSVIDVVAALTDSINPNDYWYKIKKRASDDEKIELSTICRQLKLTSKDGKNYLTDCANTKGILRIIQSIPSKKAEPFKLWLAQIGSERIEEINNPEIAVKRARDYYKQKGYNEQWINQRMFGIEARNKLTDEWQIRGLLDSKDYAILTNQIYKSTFNYSTKELRQIKRVTPQSKSNLRDRMNPLELNITSLAELTSQELHVKNDSFGKEELMNDVKSASKIASNTRKQVEKELGHSIITRIDGNIITK